MKSEILEPDRFVVMLLEATVLFKNRSSSKHFVNSEILEPKRFVIMLLEATVLFKTDRNQNVL